MLLKYCCNNNPLLHQNSCYCPILQNKAFTIPPLRTVQVQLTARRVTRGSSVMIRTDLCPQGKLRVPRDTSVQVLKS